LEAYGELEGSSAAAIEEWWREETPMKRFVENSEVANAVVFLASAASSGMTGQALNVTGGVVMH
jgi:NAD(P)-dependent dehydrogenase (short-subunit alcohol dehydrogenase family)